MKDYLAKDIRNVVLIGHAGAGKSTIVEASLLFTKAIGRLGKTSDGSSTVDFDDEEKRKGQSVFTAIAPVEHKNAKINFIDTPGYLDYEGEKISGFAAADAAIVVLSGKEGIETGTIKAMKLINKKHMPTLFFINKMDDENAHFDKVVAALRETYGQGVVPFSVPANGGVADVLKGENLPDYAADYLNSINETVAETDDALMDKFFEGEAFTEEEMAKGIKEAIKAGSLKPVIFGSALKGDGIEALLNAIVKYLPSYVDVAGDKEKEPFKALVFKTAIDSFVGKISYVKVVSGALEATTALYNVNKDAAEKNGGVFTVKGKTQAAAQKLACGDIGALVKLVATETNDTLAAAKGAEVLPAIEFPKPMLGKAISPKTKDDEDKMSDALKKVLLEDKSLNFVRNAETGEQVLYAVGDQQLDIVSSKLKNRYKVEIVYNDPKIQYRETIKGKCEIQGKYKKQNGGAGQYGDVWIRFEPCESEEMEFAEEVFGGSVPRNFFPAVEAGLRSCMGKGPLAGCKVVNVKATLYDGSYHPVDSKPNSFEAAARLAFKNGIPKANPILLEPVGKITVICPDAYTGDIIGDFNKRRGMIMDTGATEDGDAKIDAEVPMAEVANYAVELRQMTQGTGSYYVEFDRYEPASQDVTKKVVAAYAAVAKDDDED